MLAFGKQFWVSIINLPLAQGLVFRYTFFSFFGGQYLVKCDFNFLLKSVATLVSILSVLLPPNIIFLLLQPVFFNLFTSKGVYFIRNS